MWKKGVTDSSQVKFSIVYTSLIKNKLRKKYKEYYAFFKDPICFDDLENDIKTLVELYESKQINIYKSKVPIYDSDNKILKTNSLENRLNSIIYALDHLENEHDAYYVINTSVDKHITCTDSSMLIYKIKFIDFYILFMICFLLYYLGYISFKKSIILLSSMVLILYIFLYKL
jgi:hypothetical protein